MADYWGQVNLTGPLAPLKAYNGLTIPVEYFEEAIQRLRTKHLNVPIDTVLHPVSSFARDVASEQQTAAEAAPPVAAAELTAEQWFERGYGATDPDEEIFLYTQAITLKPDLAAAYCNRGNAHYAKNNLGKALSDVVEFIRLAPYDHRGRLNRGNLYLGRGELDRAVADFDESIRLESWNPGAYLGRAKARLAQSQYWTVAADLSQFLEMTEGDEERQAERSKIAETLEDLRLNPPSAQRDEVHRD